MNVLKRESLNGKFVLLSDVYMFVVITVGVSNIRMHALAKFVANEGCKKKAYSHMHSLTRILQDF